MLAATNKKKAHPFRSKSQLKLPRGPLPEQQRRLAHSYKLTLSSVGVMDSLKHHRATPDAKLVHALHPQLQKKTLENVYRVNKSRSLKQILEAKLRTQEQRINDLKLREETRQKELARARRLQTRERERQARASLLESQQQRQLERSWRQKTQNRQRSESSFLRETRRDSIGMLRSSREVHNRSQQSLADQQLRETVRSSKYDQEHRTLQRRQQHYEQQYRKAFLRNSPSPRQDLPETVFYSTLRERAQKITQTYALPQHLPSIAKKSSSRPQQKAGKAVGSLQQDLMISSMRPADPKNKKLKPVNPETSTPPLQSKTPTPTQSPPQDPAPVPQPVRTPPVPSNTS